MSYSVIIPAFNVESYVTDAIASALRQTIRPAEIIVIDDGSTDGTAQAVARMGSGVTLLQQTNQGPGAATSAGIAAVRTDLIAGLDADDLWLPHKMEIQLEHMRASPLTGACFAQTCQFTDGQPVNEAVGITDAWTRTTMVVRTDVALAVGPLRDQPGRVGELVDWIGQMREQDVRTEMIPRVLALRRARPGSLTAMGAQSVSRGYLAAARNAILRRRAATTGTAPQGGHSQ